MEKAMEWEERIPLGVFYKEEGRLTSEDREPALAQKPLVELPLGVSDIDGLLGEFY